MTSVSGFVEANRCHFDENRFGVKSDGTQTSEVMRICKQADGISDRYYIESFGKGPALFGEFREMRGQQPEVL
jgi:hypothetical protein